MCATDPDRMRVRIFDGITRKTAPLPLRSMKTFARKRATPASLVGEVGIVPARELFAILLRHDRLEQGSHRRKIERRGSELEHLDRAILPNQRGHADAQVQVGGALLTHHLEKAIDRGGHWVTLFRRVRRCGWN